MKSFSYKVCIRFKKKHKISNFDLNQKISLAYQFITLIKHTVKQIYQFPTGNFQKLFSYINPNKNIARIVYHITQSIIPNLIISFDDEHGRKKHLTRKLM